jgi:hypothetical protein
LVAAWLVSVSLKPHGRGIEKYPDDFEGQGAVYEGQFEDGEQNGWGTMKLRNGDVVEGKFKNNELHEGTHKCSPGRDSTYIPGQPIGLGGSWYKGQLKDGKPHGKGTLKQHGNELTGQFHHGSFKGICKYVDGRVYEGQIKNDYANGHGTMKYPSGTVYQGQFKEGTMNGHGTKTYWNGRVEQGEFIEGVYAGNIEEETWDHIDKGHTEPKRSLSSNRTNTSVRHEAKRGKNQDLADNHSDGTDVGSEGTGIIGKPHSVSSDQSSERMKQAARHKRPNVAGLRKGFLIK